MDSYVPILDDHRTRTIDYAAHCKDAARSAISILLTFAGISDFFDLVDTSLMLPTANFELLLGNQMLGVLEITGGSLIFLTTRKNLGRISGFVLILIYFAFLIFLNQQGRVGP